MSLKQKALLKLASSPVIWQYGLNLRRTLLHRAVDRRPDSHDAKLLQAEGILVRSPETIFDDDGMKAMQEAISYAAARYDSADTQRSIEERLREGTGKEFLFTLLPKELDANSMAVRLALQPKLVEMANAYLGMRSYLRTIQLWANIPTSRPAAETQLWHQDDDDLKNLKVFIYLNDVTLGNGPFCYIPGTQPGGRWHGMRGIRSEAGRVTDEAMEAVFAKDRWTVCTGPAGTIVIADTIGYHKGLKPTERHRLLLLIQYTSGTPRYPRSVKVTGAPERSLDPTQHDLLYPQGDGR